MLTKTIWLNKAPPARLHKLCVVFFSCVLFWVWAFFTYSSYFSLIWFYSSRHNLTHQISEMDQQPVKTFCSYVLQIYLHLTKSSSPVLGLHPAFLHPPPPSFYSLSLSPAQTSILSPSFLPQAPGLCGHISPPHLVSFPLTLEQMAGPCSSLCELDWQGPVINLHRWPVICRSTPLRSTVLSFKAPLSYSPPNLLCFHPDFIFLSKYSVHQSSSAAFLLYFFCLKVLLLWSFFVIYKSIR